MVVYIPAVFILVAVAFALLSLGHYKEDFVTLFLAGTIFVLLGLTTFNEGFQDLSVTFTKWLGIIFMGFGGYISIRSALDFMMGNFDAL